MLRIAYIIIFVISIAASVYGFLLSNEIRRKAYLKSISSSLMYQQIFIYVFGFYGIWGHLLSNLIMQNYVTNTRLLERINDSISTMAIPFLLISWFFLLKIGFELLRQKRNNLFAALSLFLSLLFCTAFVLFSKTEIDVLSTSILVFGFENAAIAIFVIAAIVLSKKVKLAPGRSMLFVSSLLAISISLLLTGAYNEAHPLVAAGFILFFFLANTLLPFTFQYFLQHPAEKQDEPDGLNAFVTQYGISKREAEIIELICQGLSNKEIAAKLFISLQTVKDHTSRIYLKTEVKNRTHLAQMVMNY